MEYVIQLLSGALGSVGFALIFRLRACLLPLAALGGLLNWGIYLLLFHLTGNLFLSAILASAATAVYAELLARRLRAPTTLFLVPAVIPSIPGSNLYYTMRGAVTGNFDAVAENALLTLEWAFAIAGGISIVTVVFSVIKGIRKKRANSKENLTK